jgi:hypothetical protein
LTHAYSLLISNFQVPTNALTFASLFPHLVFAVPLQFAMTNPDNDDFLYRALQRVPIYGASNHGDAHAWLRMVERSAPAIKTMPVADSLGVIMTRLDGVPLSFTDHCLDTQLSDWSAFKAAFLGRFGPPARPADVIFPVTNFQWTSDDTAASAAKRFNDAVATFNKHHPCMADAVLQRLFCNKLPKRFHDIVRVSAAVTQHQTLETFQEALLASDRADLALTGASPDTPAQVQPLPSASAPPVELPLPQAQPNSRGERALFGFFNPNSSSDADADPDLPVDVAFAAKLYADASPDRPERFSKRPRSDDPPPWRHDFRSSPHLYQPPPRNSPIVYTGDPTKLLSEVNIQLSMHELCKVSPSVRQSFQKFFTSDTFVSPVEDRLVAHATHLQQRRTAHAWIRIQGIDFDGVLDGGSDFNIVTMKTLHKLGVEDKIVLKADRCSLADGTPSAVPQGAIDLVVNVGRHTITANFLVFSHSLFDILLGARMLADCGLIADYPTGNWSQRYQNAEHSFPVFYKPDTQTSGNFICFLGELKPARAILPPHGPQPLLDLAHDLGICTDRLTVDQTLALVNLREEFSDIFHKPGQPVKAMLTSVKHHIHLTDRRPIQFRPRPLALRHEKFVREHLQQQLSTQMYEARSTPFLAPITVQYHPVTQKARFCGDYRAINRATVPRPYPTPMLEELFAKVGAGTWWSELDLVSSFNQIEMDNVSKGITGFICKWGTFISNRMPFGVVGGSFDMQRALDELLGDLHFLIVYIDDMVLQSTSFVEHLRHLRTVITLQPSKCNFAKETVTFLGFKLGKGGVTLAGHKRQKLLDLPEPTTSKQLRQYLPMMGYYRRLILDFAKWEAVFSDIRNSKTFTWTEQHAFAFQQLKTAIINPPILQPPLFDRPFLLYCDASSSAIGGVLKQLHGDLELPIWFHSEMLRTDLHEPIFVKEFFAIIRCLKKFRPYILGYPIRIYTDNIAVVHLARKEDFPNLKIERWVYKLQDYQCELLYKSGRDNTEADVLSRQILYMSDFIVMDNYNPPHRPFKLIANIFRFLVLQQNLDGVDAKQMQTIRHHARNYRFDRHLLYRKRASRWVLVPTIAERPALLQEAHDGRGHFGTQATFQYLNE